MAKNQKTQDLLASLESNDMTEVDPAVEETLENFVNNEESDSSDEVLDDVEVRKANIEALKNEMLKKRAEINMSKSIPTMKSVYDIPDNFIKLEKSDVPSKGMFYYPETEIYIRAANVSEIRNWSMWESDDISVVDSKLNFILKNCCILRDPVNSLSWRDIKDMDRLYIILAIRDLTFPPGTNDLMISISQDKKIPVKKESVDFIELPDSLLNKYNEDSRCFSIMTPEDKAMNFYIPSLGTAEWIKDYIIGKSRAQEPFDQDFCQLVPYMIDPSVRLDERVYDKLYSTFKKLSIFELSALSEFKNIISKSVNPTFTFEDEAGGKQTVPFSFLGGFRSLFVIQNIF